MKVKLEVDGKVIVDQDFQETPTPPVPPIPPIPPEPPPEPPTDEPKPDWDAGWPLIEGGAQALYNRLLYPSITKGGQGTAYGLVFPRDAEISYANFLVIGPYTEQDYGYSLVPPLKEVKKFYDYYSKWVPCGLPNSGVRNSLEIAFLAHSQLRYHIGNCCSWYAYGSVSWDSEVPHGFNLVIAYENPQDIYNWNLYFFDVSKGIPVTLVKLVDPYKINSFFGFDAG